MTAFLFFLNAAFCALNVTLFVLYQDPWSLGAAILSGFVAFAVVSMS